jgi:Zn-dependent protease with chaperone function
VLNSGLVLTARLFSARALRIAKRKNAREAACLLFRLRVLPSAGALAIVLCFILPSYLCLEPEITGERPGCLCIAVGAFGALTLLTALGRSFHAILASLLYTKALRSTSAELYSEGCASRILVVESELPVIALTGLFRPQIVLSRNAIEALSSEQIEAVSRHEAAHLAAFDNFKRLLLLLTPNIFLFLDPLSRLEQHWMRFIEWSADDSAAGGSPYQAVALAESLIRVARLGSPTPLPKLQIGLVSSSRELATRVKRLLRPAPEHSVSFVFLGPGLSRKKLPLVTTALSLTVALWFAILPAVHAFLERFFH